MPGTVGPRLGLVWGYSPHETGWGVGGFNPNFAKLEALVHLTVIAVAATPPATPANGDCYIVAASPTDAWVGHADDIAVYYTSGGWIYIDPAVGIRAFDRSGDGYVRFDGVDWVDEIVPAADVTGPASAVDGNISVYDGTTGKLIKDGGKALPTGLLVGTIDVQILENKIIDGADNSLVVHLDTDVVGNLPIVSLGGGVGASGTTVFYGDGVWRVPGSDGGSVTLPSLAQGEVLGNPDVAAAEAAPAALLLVLRAALGDGVAGQALLSGGTAVDPAWGDIPTAPTPPVLHQGEVLGNPSAPDGGAVPADLALMLRAALGDGVAGQAILSGGSGVDPAWATLPAAPYRIGLSFVGGVLAASQLLGMHKMARAVTLPANFAGSRAGGSANATASTVITVERALAASPNTFISVGTITFAAGTITPTFATSGSVALADNDVLRVVGPATADASFANFYCTIVEN